MRRIGDTPVIAWASLAVSMLALIVAMSGVGFARTSARRGSPSRAGRVVRLGANGRIPAGELPVIPAGALPKIPVRDLPKLSPRDLPRIPASDLPTVVKAKVADNANMLDGKSEAQLVASCPPGAVDIGTWCLDQAPFAVPATDVGQNNYAYATRTCESLGGYLPDAGQLIGAANKVPLESVLTDSPTKATIDQNPADGLSDQREMSSSLVTVAAGSDAAGSEGVSQGATGNPTLGAPDPIPEPAVPFPETLQYVTVYDNFQKGGFAGSEPVSTPENFRCAFNKVSTIAQTRPSVDARRAVTRH